jgi:hypothetical protein
MQSLRSCPGLCTWHRNLEPSSSPAYLVKGLQDATSELRIGTGQVHYAAYDITSSCMRPGKLRQA